MKSFFECTRPELSGSLIGVARANRLYKGIYRNKPLSSADRSSLNNFGLTLPAIVQRFDSEDGTRRILLRLEDGETVESVVIPEEGRFTFCVSSQIGCALACRFCLTGQLGLRRNLSTAEIVSQVMAQLADNHFSGANRFSVVLMGMGEPLQNYDNVMKAIRILSDDHGLALPLHRITLSTAGLVPGLQRLATEKSFPNVSISLTGSTNGKRDDLMPINRRHPIEEVIGVIREWPASRRKRVMFEYVMIKGVTDEIDDARNLVSLFSGLGTKVNLIPLNESPDLNFQRPDRAAILQFQNVLLSSDITTFIRKTRGDDVYGACGQLKKQGVL
jgi:23S rRNA (adenine2503-C2)-methyltransferase